MTCSCGCLDWWRVLRTVSCNKCNHARLNIVWAHTLEIFAVNRIPRTWGLPRIVFPCPDRTRLSTDTNNVQHYVLRYTYRCFSGLWWWLSFQIPLWWQTIQPKKVASQIKGTDRYAGWAALCRWHGNECLNRMEKQETINRISQACDNFDLKRSTKRTEVVHHPAHRKQYNEPTITVNRQRLRIVDKFTKWWRSKYHDCQMLLRSSVWDRSGIRLDSKLTVYRAVVLQTLLYAYETW